MAIRVSGDIIKGREFEYAVFWEDAGNGLGYADDPVICDSEQEAVSLANTSKGFAIKRTAYVTEWELI